MSQMHAIGQHKAKYIKKQLISQITLKSGDVMKIQQSLKMFVLIHLTLLQINAMQN